MSYIGDEDVPAPRLHEYQHDDLDELASLWEQLHRAIERMLYRDIVHGDLSSYNILVWDGEVTLIDFPQGGGPEEEPPRSVVLGARRVQARRAFRTARTAPAMAPDRARSLDRLAVR